MGENTGVTQLRTLDMEGAARVPEGSEYISSVISYPKGIRKLILPDSLGAVDRLAFQNCASLESVSGGNVRRIGQHAFQGCTNLYHFDIAPSADIGKGAFQGCAFRNVRLQRANLHSGAFASCKYLETVYLDEDTSISFDAFDDCYSIRSFVYPDKEFEAVCVGSICVVIKRSAVVNGANIYEGNTVDNILSDSATIYIVQKDGAIEMYGDHQAGMRRYGY